MSSGSPTSPKKYPCTFTEDSNLIGWQEKYSEISERFLSTLRKNKDITTTPSNIRRRRYLSRHINLTTNNSEIFNKTSSKLSPNRSSIRKVSAEEPLSVSVNRLLLDVPDFQINKSDKTMTRTWSKKRTVTQLHTPRMEQKKGIH